MLALAVSTLLVLSRVALAIPAVDFSQSLWSNPVHELSGRWIRALSLDHSTAATGIMSLMDTAGWGEPSKLQVRQTERDRPAPKFLLTNGVLYQFTNVSYIMPVNVMNTTTATSTPIHLPSGLTRAARPSLRLETGRRADPKSVKGTWEWVGGEMGVLHFTVREDINKMALRVKKGEEHIRPRSNVGIFWSCEKSNDREAGLYMDVDSAEGYLAKRGKPDGCTPVTLHNWQ